MSDAHDHRHHDHGHAGHDHAGHVHGPACHHDGHAHHDQAAGEMKPGLVKDPVCGMDVDPHTAKHRAEYQGIPYYFCSAGCRTKFEADPAKYLAPAAAKPAEPVPEGTIYTCPMHPQIRQVGPGTCPICGMALEPVVATAETGPNPELADMTRRFWIGLALALPVFVLEMGGHLFGLEHMIAPQTSNWIQLALATPVVLWAGWPFFERGWQSLVNRSLNMFTLIAMGTGVAWVYSASSRRSRPASSRRRSASTAAGRRLLRGRRGHHRPGPARPGAGAAGAREHERRHPRPARPRAEDGAAHARRTARTRRSRSTRSRSATGCACGRARRSRSTARWSRAAAPSTNRW